MSHGIRMNDSMLCVRRVLWDGLGVALDAYPKSIDKALEKAGLGCKVTHGDILDVKASLPALGALSEKWSLPFY